MKNLKGCLLSIVLLAASLKSVDTTDETIENPTYDQQQERLIQMRIPVQVEEVDSRNEYEYEKKVEKLSLKEEKAERKREEQEAKNAEREAKKKADAEYRARKAEAKRKERDQKAAAKQEKSKKKIAIKKKRLEQVY